MARIAKRPQECDGNRLDARVEELRDGSAGRILVEREQDGSGVIHPLAHLPHELGRYDGFGMTPPAVPAKLIAGHAGGEAHQTLDTDGVGESKRGNQPRPRARALDQRVRGLRGSVAEADSAHKQVLECQPALLSGELEPGEDALLERVRRRGLGGQHCAAGVHDGHVRERAARVDADVERPLPECLVRVRLHAEGNVPARRRT